MGTSVRKMYDAELLQLDTMLARMGHAAGGAIESAMTALRTGDTELARSVIARDSEIDSAEHEIEHRCLTLFLRQQPVAGDLRKVSTALKMVTDIERIADQASDIAEITLHLHPDGARTVGVLDDLYAMGDIALHMVKDAIAAYVQVDLSTAAQVIARDDDCDAMFSRISKEIAAYIAAHPGDAETASGAVVCASMPIVLLAFWLIVSYKVNIINPTVSAYAVEILALCAALIASYEFAGFAYGRPKAIKSIFWSQFAAFLCITALPDDRAGGQQLMLAAIAGILLFQSYLTASNIRPAVSGPVGGAQ